MMTLVSTFCASCYTSWLSSWWFCWHWNLRGATWFECLYLFVNLKAGGAIGELINLNPTAHFCLPLFLVSSSSILVLTQPGLPSWHFLASNNAHEYMCPIAAVSQKNNSRNWKLKELSSSSSPSLIWKFVSPNFRVRGWTNETLSKNWLKSWPTPSQERSEWQGTSSSNWKNLGMVNIATLVILHSEAIWRD